MPLFGLDLLPLFDIKGEVLNLVVFFCKESMPLLGIALGTARDGLTFWVFFLEKKGLDFSTFPRGEAVPLFGHGERDETFGRDAALAWLGSSYATLNDC